MEHSVQAYLKRRSAEELAGFLQTCEQRGQWAQYAHIVPHIFAELQNRGISISEHIRSSWEAYVRAGGLS